MYIYTHINVYVYIHSLTFQSGKNSRAHKHTRGSLQNLVYVPFWRIHKKNHKDTGFVVCTSNFQCGSNTGLRTKTQGFPNKHEAFSCIREFYRFWCYSGHWEGPGVWSNVDSRRNETDSLEVCGIMALWAPYFPNWFCKIHQYTIELCGTLSLHFNSRIGSNAWEAKVCEFTEPFQTKSVVHPDSLAGTCRIIYWAKTIKNPHTDRFNVLDIGVSNKAFVDLKNACVFHFTKMRWNVAPPNARHFPQYHCMCLTGVAFFMPFLLKTIPREVKRSTRSWHSFPFAFMLRCLWNHIPNLPQSAVW